MTARDQNTDRLTNEMCYTDSCGFIQNLADLYWSDVTCLFDDR